MKQTASFLEASKKTPNTSQDSWCHSIKEEQNKIKFKGHLKSVSCFLDVAKQYQYEVYQGPHNPTKQIESQKSS